MFFRLASRPIPRVSRMMAAARERGLDPVFIGAMREPSLARTDEWEGVRVERIGRPFPLVNGTRPLTYLRGVVGYGVAAVRLIFARRPALAHASDIEAAMPVILAGRLLGIPVIYNIHDNLAARYSVPRWVAAILNLVEGLVVCAATVTLVPEPFRRDLLPRWARARVLVVRNSPDDPGFAAGPNEPASPPRVLFAGWLDYGRGLRQVIELARAGTIHLVVAGEGDPRVLEQLSTTPNVEYLGFCAHRRIMELVASCDFVAAFYDPARPINRYAASNKIAEALAVGRPVLTNIELKVAPGLVAAGVALAVPYDAIATIGTQLDALRTNPLTYREASVRARKLYDSDYHPAQVRRVSFEALTAAGCAP